MENEYVSFGCMWVIAPIGAWMEGKDLVWPGEASSIQLPEETTGSEIIGSPSRESVDGKWCFSDLSPCESVPCDAEAISVESHPWTQSTSFCGFGINSQCTCVHALGEGQRYPTGDWASIHIWGTSRIRDFWSSEYFFLLVNLRQLDSHKKFKRPWECLDIHKDILSDIHWQGEDPLKKQQNVRKGQERTGKALAYLHEALSFILIAANHKTSSRIPEAKTLTEQHPQLPPWKPGPSALFEDCRFNQGTSQNHIKF